MLSWFRDTIQRRRRGRKHYPAVYNANRVNERDYARRALLVYLPRAFLTDENDPKFLAHQNMRRCRTMSAILGDMGYVVDVINKKDRYFRPRYTYDLVIGERLDWAPRAPSFGPQARHVFLATAPHHAFHNDSVRRRHARLLERGRPEIAVRRVYNETMPAVHASHALVGVGNEYTVGTWRRAFSGPLFPFNTFELDTGVLVEPARDLPVARRNFLYFASGSQMQKGLDLLLEIFPRHPDLHLYVCSRFAAEPDFCRAYNTELFATPNVHPIGWISVGSADFLELLRTCAYVILPSCAEGQSGAVVHCMHSGLIPVVTPAVGIDTGDFGVTLADDDVETLERVVVDLAQRPPAWLREREIRTTNVARQLYSQRAFASRWREIVESISALPR